MTEAGSLRAALERIVAVMGPTVPSCSGCNAEWSEALRVAAAALSAASPLPEPAWPPFSEGMQVIEILPSYQSGASSRGAVQRQDGGPSCPHCGGALNLGALQAEVIRKVCGDPVAGIGLAPPPGDDGSPR
jgi:hypothetical protein